MKCLKIGDKIEKFTTTESMDDAAAGQLILDLIKNDPSLQEKIENELRSKEGEQPSTPSKSLVNNKYSAKAMLQKLSQDYQPYRKLFEDKLKDDPKVVIVDNLPGNKLGQFSHEHNEVRLSNKLIDAEGFKTINVKGVLISGEEVLVHELMHKTVDGLYNESQALQADIKSIIKSLDGNEIIKDNWFYSDLLTKPHEFFVHALTNREFQKTLAAIPVSVEPAFTVSAWGKFLNAIKKLLGIESTTMLDRVFALADNFETAYIDFSGFKAPKGEDWEPFYSIPYKDLTADSFKKIIFDKESITSDEDTANNFNSSQYDSPYQFVQARATSNINKYKKDDYVLVWKANLNAGEFKPVVGLNKFFNVIPYTEDAKVDKNDYILFRRKSDSNTQKAFVTKVFKDTVRYMKTNGDVDTVLKSEIKVLGKFKDSDIVNEDNVISVEEYSNSMNKAELLNKLAVITNVQLTDIEEMTELKQFEDHILKVNPDVLSSNTLFYDTGLVTHLAKESPNFNDIVTTYPTASSDKEATFDRILYKYNTESYLNEEESKWFDSNVGALEETLATVVDQLKGYGWSINDKQELFGPTSQVLKTPETTYTENIDPELKRIQEDLLRRNYCRF